MRTEFEEMTDVVGESPRGDQQRSTGLPIDQAPETFLLRSLNFLSLLSNKGMRRVGNRMDARERERSRTQCRP